MADVALQTIDLDGHQVTYEAAAADDTFVNDGNTIFIVVNGSGADCEVTFTSQVPTAHPGEAIADKVVDVPAGETWFIGPFNQAAFNNAAGKVEVAYESTTTITVAAAKLSY